MTGDTTTAPTTTEALGSDDLDEIYSAPLRQGPWWERGIRYLLVLLLLGTFARAAVGILGPTVIEPGGTVYAQLVNDIAAGRVVAIDDTRERRLLWRTRDGEVYVDRRYDEESVGLRASVAAQPFVKANPGSIRWERIDARIPPGEDEPEWFDASLYVLFLVMLGTGPQPRHLTRWGWFWASLTGVGLVAYPVLSGSRVRKAIAVPRRVDGLRAAAVCIPAAVALGFLMNSVEDTWHRGTEDLAQGTVAPMSEEYLRGKGLLP